MTVTEHRGTGVVILNRYPWRVELAAAELMALAVLAADPNACHAAALLSCRGDDRRAQLLAQVSGLSCRDRLRLVDECAEVVDLISPPWLAPVGARSYLGES